jgi:hypothetical protein
MSALEGLRVGTVDFVVVLAAAAVFGAARLGTARFDSCELISARVPDFGISSLLENILVNRVFKDFSACFG